MPYILIPDKILGMKKITFLSIALLLSACSSSAQNAPSATVPSNTYAAIPTYTKPMMPSPTVEKPMETPVEIRLIEDFSGEGSCFSEINDPNVKTGIENGSYRIEILTPSFIPLSPCETLVIGNFVMEVDVNLLEIPDFGVSYYGLAFRISGVEYYAFAVGNMQNYCIFEAGEGTYTYLTDSTDFSIPCWVNLPQAAIKEGTQRMKVVAEDDRMDFYLNGELLSVVRDNRLQAGWVGFTAATAGEGTLLVEFDNLKVTQP